MKQVKINEFSEFELTPSETLAGQIFSVSQLQVLQNERILYIREKLNLQYTPDNLNDYLQKEASLKGKIDMLNYIFECHEFALAEVSEIHADDLQQDSNTTINTPSSPISQIFG